MFFVDSLTNYFNDLGHGDASAWPLIGTIMGIGGAGVLCGLLGAACFAYKCIRTNNHVVHYEVEVPPAPRA